MPELADEAALIRAAQDNPEAFGKLYERYIGRIYSYIYYRTGNASEAEDLTARVFFRAHSHIGHFKQMGLPFSAWLYRIAHNLVANWHRDNSRRSEISLDDNTQVHQRGDLPEAEIINGEEFEDLMKVVRVLPDDRQHLIILKFVEGLSNQEIGLIIGRSEGAVKSLYHRTLEELRDKLGNKNSSGRR